MTGQFEKETPFTFKKVVDEQFTEFGYLPPLSLILFNGEEVTAVRCNIYTVELIVNFANEGFNKGRESQINRSRNFVVVDKNDQFVFGNDQFNS